MNPEFRQTLNVLSHNIEAANQTAQENIYTFTQLYIDPCLAGLKSCVSDCTAPCFPNRDSSLRRKRGRSRGRREFNFDFYDDWEDDEDISNAGMQWGNDELDSLLAGRGSGTAQPKRQRAMSYGARGRRRAGTVQGDINQDPNVIPSSSYLGFLDRLPWKIGTKVLRYTPSAADLQENPGGVRMRDEEVQPLIEEDENENITRVPRHGRQRSGTTGSQSTTNSLSSRGDLIMSDEEDDAVPLDDEFAAVMLSRRMTNSEDQISGRLGLGKRPAVSRRSTRTVSSKSARSGKTQRSASQKSGGPLSPAIVDETVEFPSMQELAMEEEQVRREEEMEIEQKREVAQRLAISRGLSAVNTKSTSTNEVKPELEEEVTPMTIMSPRPETPDSRETFQVSQPERFPDLTTPPENTDTKPP